MARSLARLIAVANALWCLEQTPVLRLASILRWFERYRLILSMSL